MVETESRFNTESAGGETGSTYHPPLPGLPSLGPAMTRCECMGISFEALARRMAQERWTAEEAVRRTGCGGMCTACLPDLTRYLAVQRPQS